MLSEFVNEEQVVRSGARPAGLGANFVPAVNGNYLSMKQVANLCVTSNAGFQKWWMWCAPRVDAEICNAHIE